MKIRMGFITNSSSTNFLIISKEELTEDYLFEKLGFIKEGMLEKQGRELCRSIMYALDGGLRYAIQIEFERWCENYDSVKSYYKNGDKGDEYFSIIYRKAFRRSNFYPDYIIELENGEIWIIEAKGGMSADGSSNNIDGYAERKFNALKEYAERTSGIHWGFARAVGTQIYLSNTVWSEDMTNRNIWKPIEAFI